MARQPTFPITIMAGSTAIKIYLDPLRASGPRANGTATSEAGNGAEKETKSYDSYVVSYYQGAKRLRTRHNSLQAARDKAESIKTAILNEDLTALTLKGEDCVIYARAKNLVSHLGVALDQVAKQYADAVAVLGDVSLMEAVRFYERFGEMVTTNKSVPAIVQELNANLKADGKSAYHVRDMKRRLETFALAFPAPIMEVKTAQISEWLRNLKGRDKEGCEVELAPKTRKQSLRCDVRASFAIAFSTWRQQHNIPLKQVAMDLGISISTVSAWELGQRFPSGCNFELLVAYTGLPPCKLFCVMADKCVPSACLLATEG